MSVYSESVNDIPRAAAGDRQAFVRLVEAYANTVTSIAMAISRDIHASQDIAQEVFLVAWRDMRKLRNPSSFLPWIRQITRNHAIEWLRARKGERGSDEILAAAVDSRPIASEALEHDERQRIVNEVIDELPDDAREVVTLFYKEGRSVRQVAELLDLREDAVKKRLSRARSVIREEILERYGEVVKKSAPAMAIAAFISTSVSTPAAAATTLAAKAAGATLGTKLLAAAAGSFLGAALGIGGVLFGVRKNLERAIDDEERRELKRFGVINSVIIMIAAIGIGLSGLFESATLLIATQIFFVASCGWMHVFRLPQIISRRLAAEREEDPNAAKRQRREALRSAIGLTAGIVVSSATVVWAVVVLLQR